MYEIGDYIVKAVNGLCKVQDIMHLDMSGTDKNRLYYLLVPVEDEKGKIYIPTDTADMSIRRVMTEEEALDLIDKVTEIDELMIENEKIREQKYKEVIRSCNPEALIGIIKMLYHRRKERLERGQKSTIVDDRYFTMAENNLYSELGFVLNKGKEEICALIESSARKKEQVLSVD